MTPSSTIHALGPADGFLRVRTFREGLAQKVGHDLTLEASDWRATVAIGADTIPAAVTLEADPASLHVIAAVGGAKPLTDADRVTIRDNIARRVVGRDPIEFGSRTVAGPLQELKVTGNLTIAGVTRLATLSVALGEDRRARGVLAIRQSDWGITPYRALMGALKVRDAVEIVFELVLPAAAPPVTGP